MFIGGPLAVLALAATTAVMGQQTYPSKPVQIIAPTNVGSGPDLLARLLAVKLSERWGQQVLVVNRMGATTMVGTAEAARADPDGYTLVLVPDAYSANAALIKLPFDPIKDLAPVAQVALGAMVLCVHPSVPAKTVAEFVDYAKRNPGKLNYGSAGNGSTHHMMMATFAHLADLTMVHVPYGGGPGKMQNDLVEGRLSAAFLASNGAIPLVSAGRLRALGVAGEKRLPYWPELPTIAEQGFTAFDPELWYGLLAPGATPRPVVDKIYADVAWALALPDLRERLNKMGMEPAPMAPDAFTRFIHEDIARKKKLVQDIGIKTD
jgi:tripartite-type tricarboxylate transporter receptor subunit TctC